MMDIRFLRKAPGLPSLHAGEIYGNHVDSAILDRDIAADLFEASAPENLTLAVDIVQAEKAVIIFQGWTLEVCRAGDTQQGIGGKFTENEFKMFLVKGNIGV